jgi:hypothetical protein
MPVQIFDNKVKLEIEGTNLVVVTTSCSSPLAAASSPKNTTKTAKREKNTNGKGQKRPETLVNPDPENQQVRPTEPPGETVEIDLLLTRATPDR